MIQEMEIKYEEQTNNRLALKKPLIIAQVACEIISKGTHFTLCQQQRLQPKSIGIGGNN
jgi:hypothetical protein